jgi:hypothetical protein
VTLEIVSNHAWKFARATAGGPDLAARLDRARPAVPDDVILVGELNPYGSAAEMALWPLPERAAGHRLGQILDLAATDQMAAWRANLCSGSWSAPAAAAKANILLCGPWKRYVLLGARVRKAFAAFLSSGTKAEIAALTRTESVVAEVTVDGRRLLMLPHPSGRCRSWNVPGTREATEAAFRRFVGTPS